MRREKTGCYKVSKLYVTVTIQQFPIQLLQFDRLVFYVSLFFNAALKNYIYLRKN